ncbi:MAG TPA: acetate--CoA ligase family protein [Candidatus Binatia bacterium]|nr:acetate--CoA ligase family protein [Candidatus Binatia bacterium]
MSDPRVGLLFNPQSVAIVGASADLAKASGLPLRNIVNSKFAGKIYPVNLRAAEISGVKCYPTVTDLPEAPDVAVLMIDAKLTAQILEQCGKKGVKTAIIGSAGFAEAGPEGQARQDEISAIGKRYDIRVVGPNCHGTFNVYRNIPCGYDHAFALPIKPGPVAIASHSGALLGVIGHRAVQANLGFSYMVSNGNEMDVDLCDFTEFFLEDSNTKVAAVLMEGLKNGPRFLELAERAHELGKRIVVLKVGKSERGAITTMAHTARMAGAGEVYEAAFRQYGIISTDTVENFIGTAQLAAHQPVPRGGRIVVMTSSGAGASLMADKASEYGIELADISEQAQAKIPQRRSAILTNPFDTAGTSRAPGFLQAACEAFAEDKANDCMVMYMGPLAVRHEYGRQFAAAAEKFGKTAAAIINLSENDMRDIFQAKNIPVFDAATDACFRMLRGYIDYGQFLERRASATPCDVTRRPARTAAARILAAHADGAMLSPAATVELLSASGFQCAEAVAATTAAQAKAAATRLGYPVILKAIVPDLAHRSDAGLVSRCIGDAGELASEFDRLTANAKSQRAAPLQVNVEKFIAHDLEVILGVKYDATFGPVVLCGLGGIFTEVLNDFALRLAPLAQTDAVEMLRSLKAYPVLLKTPASIEMLNDALLSLSDLALELNGKIQALDINPIALGGAADRGAIVLDAKVHIS